MGTSVVMLEKQHSKLTATMAAEQLAWLNSFSSVIWLWRNRSGAWCVMLLASSRLQVSF